MSEFDESVDVLLALMRAGDREAAARFMTRFGGRIRARVRAGLSPGMRRLFDSQDLMSTVTRRLDALVRARGLVAASQDQLWALVFTIARNSLAEKGRIIQRLRRVEGPDSEFAMSLAQRIETREPEELESEIARAFEALDDADDRQILSLWLSDLSHQQIADCLMMPAGTIRWRWSRIRDRLRELAA